jgi:hypothetical protein
MIYVRAWVQPVIVQSADHIVFRTAGLMQKDKRHRGKPGHPAPDKHTVKILIHRLLDAIADTRRVDACLA